MKVIIPYQDDHRNGTELKYAIRSLEKYFTSFSGIILVGDKPRWYKGDYIKWSDTPLRKEYSMYDKAMCGIMTERLKLGLRDRWIREQYKFLYSTDDNFMLKPFDENLPNYYWQTCEWMALNNSSGRYRKQYRNCPPGWLNYDIHCPIVMSPFQWNSNDKETDTPIKSTYANRAGVQGTEMQDCKFANPHTKEQIYSIIKDRLFFSTSPFCMNRDMMEVLEELFPEKSSCE